ncbi:hypothetical protein HNQ62_002858 [Sulfurisphaera ohwakuensis]|uniref:Uncharacterized protein n=1 Tax=Sulfurisphaera ohwakuensis TaxID=69656 RepID=A0A7J9RVS3_SULOH|nr:hypothetical protein [Sulfurisphaera ohwakuensis]
MIPWVLFSSSLFEFCVTVSIVMEGIIGGYFTLLLIIRIFYIFYEVDYNKNYTTNNSNINY